MPRFASAALLHTGRSTVVSARCLLVAGPARPPPLRERRRSRQSTRPGCTQTRRSVPEKALPRLPRRRRSGREIGFDEYQDAGARFAADEKTWQRVIQMLRSGAMPPEDSPQPSRAERRQSSTGSRRRSTTSIATSRPIPAASRSAGSTGPNTTTRSATCSASRSARPTIFRPTTSAAASTTSATC